MTTIFNGISTRLYFTEGGFGGLLDVKFSFRSSFPSKRNSISHCFLLFTKFFTH